METELRWRLKAAPEVLASDLLLQFATGKEPFDDSDGPPSREDSPDPGEVIWADAAGVTCRRWNWRQCRRTRLTSETRNAYFVLDRLEPYTIEQLHQAGQDLMELLTRFSAGCRLECELLGRARNRLAE